MDNSYLQLKPVFEKGLAQPVFPFTDGKTGEDYAPEKSAVVRYCVYVETDFDMDGDGKKDLVKAFVQVPAAAAAGTYKAPALFEARPYTTGTNDDGYDHMKEVDHGNFKPFQMENLKKACAGRKAEKVVSAYEAAASADPSQWYYPDKGGDGTRHGYDNIDAYDYYLVRGYAVVESSGIGTLGSDGFEYTGSTYERDSFKAVVEWLHGDRIGFADREGKLETKADWCSGKVGMTGRSYAGTMPFAVATTGVEGLETIVPIAGISDWYSFLNQQGAQRYWPKEMLMSFLSYFCSSRYNDPELTEEGKNSILQFHNQFTMDQLKCGFDYDEKFWGEGNYTLNWKNLKCSALIIHGLNDENVSTKQFEMMMDSFQKAGQNVKVILHQGPHFTPTMANKGYGISVDGQNYDDIVNKWLSHYLFDQKNGACKMPAVLVQDNNDQHHWIKEDQWHTGLRTKLISDSEGMGVIDTDWEKASLTPENFDQRMSLFSTNMNLRLATKTLESPITIQGTPRIDFRGALKTGDAEKSFEGENVNDADALTFNLGTASGKMDDIKLTLLLCDVSDEPFNSVRTTDPERNVIPVNVVEKDAIDNGPGLEKFDRVEFDEKPANYRIITRAYMDLCNPSSAYEPETAAESIQLVPGDFHDYHCYLNATRYTVQKGHRLELVIGTEDPVNCLIHKKYSVELDLGSVGGELSVSGEAADSCKIQVL